MLDRRQFLTGLLGGAAATVVLAKVDLLAVPVQAETSRDIQGLLWTRSLDEAHKVLNAAVVRLLRERGIPCLAEHVDPRPLLLGSMCASGEIITHQRGVEFSKSGLRHPDAHERIVLPAATAMADALAWRGVDRFAGLNTDMDGRGGAYARFHGITRLVVQYNICTDEMLGRLDVLGGSSEAGKRIAKAYQAKFLKMRIRQRLARTPYVPSYA